jgi:Kelch motif protein
MTGRADLRTLGPYPSFPHVEAVDVGTSTWRRLRDMPTPRHGMGAVAVNGAIYVIGGGEVAGFGAPRANERFSWP